MGDRTTTFSPCPKCGDVDSYSEYDAPSSLIFHAQCEKCGWKDLRRYYEQDESTIVLCTEEEARKNGGLVVCKNCTKEVMGSWITIGGCLECK